MCCDAPKAPPPDPAIGQAAMANAQIGKDWLAFSKEQFDKGEIRQDAYDKLIQQVVNSQLSSQDKANQWAQQDRDLGLAGKDKFDQLATDAKNLAGKYETSLNGISTTFGNQAAGQYAFADKQQGRYNNTFAPIEDKLASDAMGWDSKERLESEAAKARGDVVKSAALARQAGERNMASMGIDPRSGRFAGQQRAAELDEALGAAGAENATRDNVRLQAQQLRGQAAQVGQQVLGNANTARSLGLQATNAQQNATQAASGVATAGVTQAGQLTASGLGAAGVGYQGLGVGLTAGSSAVGNQGAGQASFNANTGIMNQGFSGAVGANNSAGSILNTQYGNQLNAWGMGQQAGAASSSGFGSMVGQLAGAGVSLYL